MTAHRTWMTMTVLALVGAGLVFSLASLIRQPGGIAAGLAVATVLTVVAGGLVYQTTSVSHQILLTVPGAILAGAMVSAVGGASVAHGLCGAALAGTGLTLLGMVASRWSSENGTASVQHELVGSSVLSAPQQLADTILSEVVVMDPELVSPVKAGVNSAVPAFDLFTSDETAELDEEESKEPDQHWSRTLAGDEDRLEGLLFAELQPEQKHCYLHVPFIPFFQTRPAATCEWEFDGPGDVDAELDQLHPYGARLTVRRRGDCSEAARIRVHLFVCGTRKLSRAA